ncbi:MAG: hypothetical protein P8X91_06215, partial [Candidatus Bathyarchaeota archaeon]
IKAWGLVQNRRGQTLAAPYCVRPKPGAPVSAPLEWKELKVGLKITDFNVYDCQTPIFDTPSLSMEELGDLYEKAFQSFYLRPSYIIRMWAKGWTYGFSETRKSLIYLFRAIKSKLRRKHFLK